MKEAAIGAVINGLIIGLFVRIWTRPRSEMNADYLDGLSGAVRDGREENSDNRDIDTGFVK
jgi:hypothetical protein